MIDSGEAKYIVPQGGGDGPPIILDVSAIVKAESRLREVAQVNSHNAAELLSTFNEHWSTLHKNVAMLTYQRNLAEKSVQETWDEALLECTDNALKLKGHAKTSKDLREAMAGMNPKVKAAKERLIEIKAVLDYISGKRKSFENAYNSVKKLLGDPNLPTAPLRYGAGDPHGDQKKRPAPDLPEDDISFEEPVEEFSDAVLSGFDEPSYGVRR